MLTEAEKYRLQQICQKLARMVHLEQGNVEIHCHRGLVRQVKVLDTSIKFEYETGDDDR